MWMWDDLLGCTGPGADVFAIEGLVLDLIFHLIFIRAYSTWLELLGYQSRQ